LGWGRGEKLGKGFGDSVRSQGGGARWSNCDRGGELGQLCVATGDGATYQNGSHVRGKGGGMRTFFRWKEKGKKKTHAKGAN